MIIIYFLMHCMLAGCGNTGFAENELKLIGKSGDGSMRLCLVGNYADSLILRGKAKELTEHQINSEKLKTLAERMLATVTAPENDGVGIAAPQVGLPYRLVIVQRFDKQGEPFELFINPRITSYIGDLSEGREGCLSIPGYWGLVKRAVTVCISYTTPEGEQRDEKIEGFTAIIFQHEIDHLDGILYTDRTEKVYPDETEDIP